MSLYRIIQRQGQDRLGEGLYWSASRHALFWTDILGQKLHSLSFHDDHVKTWRLPDTIGWIAEIESSDRLLAGVGDRIVTLGIDGDAVEVTDLVQPQDVPPGLRMNDALVDPSGRLWAGTVKRSCDQPVGKLFRLDPDLSLHCMDTDYTVANGPAISKDGRCLYHADSPLGVVYRYELDSSGEPVRREIHIEFEPGWGVPDGMACDAEGGLWIAHWGGSCVSRFDALGNRQASIALPASQITNVCFAGPSLDRMFVTSAADGVDEEHAGALFEVDCDYRGLAGHSFAGCP